jgi:Uma2 family endonuclease
MVTMPQKLLSILPLENGDRLTRHQFEQRYQAMPQIKKAELIEGVVYVAAALRFKSHAQPHGNLMIWLGTYKVLTPGVELGDNPTIRLDFDNEPQPDAILLIDESVGGQARLSEDDYVEGAPELVAEIAASSAAIDLHDKKRAYRRNGVKEYLVWQVLDQKLDWFHLQDGDYISLVADPDGIIKSRVFPGLWLAEADLLASNMQQVLAVLQAGLHSAEHLAFGQSLAAKLQR